MRDDAYPHTQATDVPRRRTPTASCPPPRTRRSPLVARRSSCRDEWQRSSGLGRQPMMPTQLTSWLTFHRTKDLIKSGGAWISSVDMERTIMAMAEVDKKALRARYPGVNDPRHGGSKIGFRPTNRASRPLGTCRVPVRPTVRRNARHEQRQCPTDITETRHDCRQLDHPVALLSIVDRG